MFFNFNDLISLGFIGFKFKPARDSNYRKITLNIQANKRKLKEDTHSDNDDLPINFFLTFC